MSLTFEIITNKPAWEQYVLTRPEANFLQSWNWSVFQETLGKKVWRLGIFQKKQQTGAALVVKETAKRGNYLTLAGGPLIDWDTLSNNELTEIFSFFTSIARQENCLFIRFRPQALDSSVIRQHIKTVHAVPSPMHLTADLTLQLNLQQTEEEILSQMRKNTRYEIRRAEKEGITVRSSQNPADIQAFYDHQVALAHKHGFVPFGYQFLLEQFQVFAADNQAVLISSYRGKELLATAYVLFYNKEAVYHYGISTPANDRLPGSYACQWAAIKEAKQRGCISYNFWGIAPVEEKNHRFSGVSLFKRGFGGEEKAYLPAHDVPVSPLYWVTYFFELFRKKARHL
jgi:lipid II:glycine glycyltransferase (peptidoglycan interpeptide bridge formation enzyme)